jgi:predicted RNase H-like HicB family nuclease
MWSEEDRAFIARVAEFPSLTARGDSRGSSLRTLKSAVDAVVRDLTESDKEVPNPAAKEGGRK